MIEVKDCSSGGALLHTSALIGQDAAVICSCFMGLMCKGLAAHGVRAVFREAQVPQPNLGEFPLPVYHVFFLCNRKGVALVWQQFISYIKKKKKILHANGLASQDFESQPSIMGNLALHND